MSGPSPWIIEAHQPTFQADVIERSRAVPVVVDFWAAWCQPCRLLAPVLEELAVEADGAFVLVKADTEQMPQVAAAFGVQGIPAVFGLRDGKVVTQFTGLLPEAEVRQWLQQLLPSETDNLVAEAHTLEVADPAAAEARFRQALEHAPNDVTARVGLARVLLAQQRLDQAQQAIEDLVDTGLLDAAGEAVWAEIAMRRQADQLGTLDQCRAAVEAAPDDLDARLRLAQALGAAGHHEEAMQTCLWLIERDRPRMGEPARELMVQLFRLLGNDGDLVRDYRRKLSMALY